MTRSVRLVASAVLAIAVATGTAVGPALAQAPLASAGPAPAALLEDLAVAYRILAMEGVIDAYGHVSARHPGNPNRFLMSRSLGPALVTRSEEHTSELQSQSNLVCRLLLEKK